MTRPMQEHLHETASRSTLAKIEATSLPVLPRLLQRLVRVTFVAFAVLALVAASACGGNDATTSNTAAASNDDTTGNDTSDGEDEAEDSSGDDTGGEASEQEQAEQDESTDDDGELETLADYLGPAFAMTVDPEAQQAMFMQQEQQAQQLIAACMASEGFEYIPVVQPQSEVNSLLGMDDEERASEIGFGITTLYGSEELFLAPEDWTDPNQAIIESMSESEREAYYDTLYAIGENTVTEIDPETGEEFEMVDGFGGGCLGEAYEEVWQADFQQEVMEALDLDSMYQRFLADPRIVAANQEWSECMSDKGYDYSDPDQLIEEALEDFSQRLEQLVGNANLIPDPFEGLSPEEIEEVLAESSPEALRDLYAQAQEDAMAAVDQDALAALQQEERDLAVASTECQRDLNDKVDEITREYEALIIEENRAILEEYHAQRSTTP